MTPTHLRYPILITNLVKRIKDEHPDKSVGKTIIQKMIYLLSLEGIGDSHYSLHHYGPYSPQIADEIDYAEFNDFLSVKWIDEQGYFIDVGNKFDLKEHHLETDVEQKVKIIVDKYSNYNAKDLSFIATARYLQTNFNINDPKEIVLKIHLMKPKYSELEIKNVLEEAEVIS